MTGVIAHLGFDVSSTGGAAVLLDSDGLMLDCWVWQEPETMGKFYRVWSLGQWADATLEATARLLFDRPDMLALSMEAPFFRGGSSALLAKAQGAVQSRFAGEWAEFAPNTVKGTAHEVTGIQTAGVRDLGKQPMLDAFIQRWGNTDLARLDRLVSDEIVSGAVENRVKAIGDLVDAAWVAETDRLRTLKELAAE